MATKKAKKKTAAKPRAKSAARRTGAARAKTATPKGLQLGSISPSLTQNDVGQSIAWYRDVVGFVVGQRWEREGVLTGAELKAGAVTIYISQEDGKRGERVKGEGFRLYLYPGSRAAVDKMAGAIKSRGGTLASEPHDAWGARSFDLLDPTGFKITVSSR